MPKAQDHSRKRRRTGAGAPGSSSRLEKPKKRMRAADYHSSSEDDGEETIDNGVKVQPSRNLKAQPKLKSKVKVADSNGISEDASSKPKAEAPPKTILKHSVQDDENEEETDSDSDADKEDDEAESSSEPDDDFGEEGDVDDDDDDDEEEDEFDEDELNDEDSNAKSTQSKLKRRNNPDHFATSLAKLLSTRIPTASRSNVSDKDITNAVTATTTTTVKQKQTPKADPILSLSREAAATSQSVADARLEAKARLKLRDQKRLFREKGRVRDVLGVGNTSSPLLANSGLQSSSALDTNTNGESSLGHASEVAATERRLKKTAQRGVVKLFNAVRAAQEQALAAEKGIGAAKARAGVTGSGVGNTDTQRAQVGEMSKQGFLDMLVSG